MSIYSPAMSLRQDAASSRPPASFSGTPAAVVTLQCDGAREGVVGTRWYLVEMMVVAMTMVLV